MRLELLPGEFAVVRLPAAAPVPAWARGGVFSSVTRSEHELSVVCEATRVPADSEYQAGFRCLRIGGRLAFAETGVLLALATPLALAGVSILAIGTYDTDYLLFPGDALETARAALRTAGHDLAALAS